MPKVSVLMPIYNSEQYLNEAIDSILEQTFSDFELIALNDGSTDNSVEILKSYSDQRIVIYNGEKNIGLANILNIGINIARGEYIARMDSDDISLINRLQIQVDYLNNHPEIDLVSCGMQEFGKKKRTYSYNTSTEECKFIAFSYTPVLHASSMWRNNSFKVNNLFYKQDSFPAEDYQLWTDVLLAGLKITNIPDVLYLYRIHDQQTTNNTMRNKQADIAVRHNYITYAFPTANEESVLMISSINEFTMNYSFYKLRKALNLLIQENVKSCFIKKKELRLFANNHYKNNVYSYSLTNKISFRNLIDMGFIRVLKLIKHRFLD